MTLSADFRKKSPSARLDEIAVSAKLTDEEKKQLQAYCGLDESTANRMIENVFGTFTLPLGLATNFKVNGKAILIPMAVEEPSVVAAASNSAKMAGNFEAKASEPIMIGQIQLVNVKDIPHAVRNIENAKSELLAKANEKDPVMVSRGGGAIDLECRPLTTLRGEMLIVHLKVNVQDAMGANAVNTMCEAISPELEKLAGGQVRLRILTNLAVFRTVKAKATWSKHALEESAKGAYSGEEVIERILDAWAFADADPFRATTHNKGIFNGIDALLLATGNDWRAVEAGGHAYASMKGSYKPLTRYSKNAQGDLLGEIELPLAVGLVGGATKTHPVARACVKILGVKTATELA
ncbi:MAG TPA: hydroxymethylglutaryl-CoA reductase, degradative, partial [Candidatus Norongarragalinales archaeon]|nr:hydroxymethylglutaryl-CoA reductase, degradative [Candidatus Norongarragalinales archaeon]